MKKVVSLMLLFAFTFHVGIAQKLPNGKSVSVRLVNELKSNTKIPQEVSMIVDRDVTYPITNAILIKRGTPIVVNSVIKKAKGVGKPAEIKLQLISTKAVDGQEVLLQGSYIATGDNRKGLSLGLGIGVGLFFWPAMFCLCIKGEKVDLPTDMLISNVVVNDDYIISTNKN